MAGHPAWAPSRHSDAYHDAVSDTRNCDQCGTLYTPRREHDRFCGAGCRAAWNSERTGDQAGGASALLWSVTAMSDTTARLAQVRVADQPRVFAVIGEAVWWVTIVDATLVRHHPDAYDDVMASQGLVRRRVIEETLGGLRFVRNRIGEEADLAEFIQPGGPGPGHGTGEAPITGWMWKLVPQPAPGLLTPRGQAWEMTRYRAYLARLAGRAVGEAFGCTAAFLSMAAAQVPTATGDAARAARLGPPPRLVRNPGHEGGQRAGA
jgi:hypothetical protein